MSLKITHKYSTAAGTPPASGDIDVGEVAINAADAELYTKDSAGNIRKFQNTTTGTADGVQFTQTGTGAVQRTVESKLQDVVSVLDFIPTSEHAAIKAGTSSYNATTAIQDAAGTGKKVYIPSGTYLCNSLITNHTVIEGDGSNATILKPFNVAIAALTYRVTGSYWSYHSEIKGIGFYGVGSKTGVGFTFSRTDPTSFVALDQFSNNVKFIGCRFFNLEKGVQFPSGNIGSEFYSCGFAANKYGVYAINNKFGGDPMQAGVKYFYAGEFNSNECAVYIHDTFGSGAFTFNNTVIEYNLIAVYFYNSSGLPITPILFDGAWFEANGQSSPSASTTVTIDSWSGSTKTTQTLSKRAFIFDGSRNRAVFRSSGIVSDIYLKATSSTVIINDCRNEQDPGFGGDPCTVDTPDSSFIRAVDCTSFAAPLRGDGIITTGIVNFGFPNIGSSSTIAGARCFTTEPRSIKVASYGPNKVVTLPLTTAASLSGSFSLNGTVVSDGRIYSNCNEFSKASFSSSQYAALVSPSTTVFPTAAGWYVVTFDIKRTAGNPAVFIWNRSVDQFVQSLKIPTLNKWYTFAALGYSPGGQTLFLDFSGSNETCTWRISAYQMLRYDTVEEAQSFLASRTFIES